MMMMMMRNAHFLQMDGQTNTRGYNKKGSPLNCETQATDAQKKCDPLTD